MTHIRYAAGIIAVVFIYLFLVTFAPMTTAGAEHSKTIVGFLLGTAMSTLIGYYWGNSSKRNEKGGADHEQKKP